MGVDMVFRHLLGPEARKARRRLQRPAQQHFLAG
jgi:hypothetical protein